MLHTDLLKCVLLTKRGEGEAHHRAEGGPHGPAVLQGGNRVYGDPEHRHQQLRGDQVHQQQVELSPQLQHIITIIVIITILFLLELYPHFSAYWA